MTLFVHDLQAFLQVPDTEMDTILAISPEQPFRLELWRRLAMSIGDSDVDLFHFLEEGVPLGVEGPLPPSAAFPLREATLVGESEQAPLLHCIDSWKSATDDPSTVQHLLDVELAQGWISVVEGGINELQRDFKSTAVGKLGLVTVPGRAPRLVVDSSVSGVRSNAAAEPHDAANGQGCFQSFPKIDGSRREGCFDIGHFKSTSQNQACVQGQRAPVFLFW